MTFDEKNDQRGWNYVVGQVLLREGYCIHYSGHDHIVIRLPGGYTKQDPFVILFDPLLKKEERVLVSQLLNVRPSCYMDWHVCSCDIHKNYRDYIYEPHNENVIKPRQDENGELDCLDPPYGSIVKVYKILKKTQRNPKQRHRDKARWQQIFDCYDVKDALVRKKIDEDKDDLATQLAKIALRRKEKSE